MNAHDTFQVIKYCSISLGVCTIIFVLCLFIALLLSVSFLDSFFFFSIYFLAISYNVPRRLIFNISTSVRVTDPESNRQPAEETAPPVLHNNPPECIFFNNRKSLLSLNALLLLLSVHIIEIH